ncbi:DUF5990 family protein [Actinopolymorpha pittospori]|uniref:Uncharacterized protein n=1 Tax=Actinopolymorpha pittospori TaxID=648752 RepID=A0A927RCP6_9ACTN|nr:DUF5990 family protein [Actinopolymorpha pittospori]MBE1607305.1 hypothetical protein [Actinopolymorpha pittospori]
MVRRARRTPARHQPKKGGIDIVSTQEDSAKFELTVDVIDGPDGLDFRGPYVQGRKGERFLYLNWGQAGADGWTGVRRAKLQLLTIDRSLVEAAMGGSVLTADLSLSDARGAPATASVRSPLLRWRTE